MTIQELRTENELLKKLLIDKEKMISELKDTVWLLQRKKFAPTSEQIKDDPQLLIFNEVEDVIGSEVDEEENAEVEVPSHKRKRGSRKPLPENLPREEVIYDLSEEEKTGLKCIGEERSEKLEIIPAKVSVKVIVRKKYEKDDSVVTASAPKELLPKTMASASLLAYIITAKYVDSLPLYRQEKIFARISADLKRQTMARWLVRVSEQLVPLYNLLQETLLERTYLKMDETRVQVLNEESKKATSKSYMWVRYAPGANPIVIYDYSPTRSGEVPKELLDGFKGVLQVDGYDGYEPACEKYGLIRAGCWDHCRRKFFDAFKTSGGKGIGKKALDLIKKLYKIEKQIKDSSLNEKLRMRQTKSTPLINEFKFLIDEWRQKITPKSVAGKGVNYAFNEWKYLTAFLDHPEVGLSNCEVENAIRPFVIGRKNWVFSSSVEGAHASAMYYSVIETAKANDLEPFDYLSKMLDKLPQAQTVEDYQRLLPFKDQFLA